MKKILTALCLSAVMPLAALAQHEEETENGIVSLAGREGFTIASKKGDFVFKPYLLVQTSANFNWYDDEGLDKAYNQDNVANSGFAIPYAVLGFTGKAFGKVSFNLSLNAAATGAALLQQAWFDVELKKQFSIRVGKQYFGDECHNCCPLRDAISLIVLHVLQFIVDCIADHFLFIYMKLCVALVVKCPRNSMRVN